MKAAILSLRDPSMTPTSVVQPTRNQEERARNTKILVETPHEEEDEETGWNTQNVARKLEVQKINLLLFSGDNPNGWILRKRYFSFHRLTKEERWKMQWGV